MSAAREPNLPRPPPNSLDAWALFIEIREPDDPSQAVGRPELVEEVVLLEPQHPFASPGKVMRGGRPHATQADDDGVEVFGHVSARQPGFTTMRTMMATTMTASTMPRIRLRELSAANSPVAAPLAS